MKTNIKMRVTPEQSRRIQEICFENGIEWLISCKLISHLPKPYLIIENSIITYRDYGRELEHNINIEEVDADLFIRTNGTCEEINFQKTQDAFNDLSIQVLEQKLKKKNEILKKDRIKRKNQREELNKLNLKLQKCISLGEHRKVLDWHIERNESLFAEIDNLKAENKSLKESSKISCNMLHSQKDTIVSLRDDVINKVDNMRDIKNKEIEKLKAVIEYLESKVK